MHFLVLLFFCCLCLFFKTGVLCSLGCPGARSVEQAVNSEIYLKADLIGAGFQFQKFSSLSSRWGHDSMQTDMVQEKELRVLHLDLRAARDCIPHLG